MTLPALESLLNVGGYVIGLIGLGVAGIGSFGNAFSKTEKLKDKTAKELVELLQTTVNTLRDDFTSLQDEYEQDKKKWHESHLENAREISRLSGENETLTKILQGRDEAHVRFQEMGFKAFAAIETMAPAMQRMLVVMEKHCEQTERWIQNDARKNGIRPAPAPRPARVPRNRK